LYLIWSLASRENPNILKSLKRSPFNVARTLIVGHFPFINAKLPKSMAIEISYPKSAMEFRESTSRLRLLNEVERLGLQLDGDYIYWDEGAKAHPRQWDRMTLYYNIAVIIFWDFFS